VLDFAGAPEAEMQLAGRLCGHCCRCFRLLTDRISLERGIGPECWGNIVARIQALAADGKRREVISFLAGAPVELIEAVLSEAAEGRAA
jgi:hypothetical protein